MQKGITFNKGFGIVVTSSPLSEERTKLGLETIKGLNLDYQLSMSPFKYYANYKYGFANGSKEERLESISSALANTDVQCLLASRGGSGALDILDSLPIDRISQARKILIGQSDLTAVLLQFVGKAKVPAIFGPTLGGDFASFNESDDSRESVLELLEVISNPLHRVKMSGDYVSSKESAEGELIGGNLSMLSSLLGTPYDVSYENKILFVEEVGESPHKIDRMLSQLILSGKLTKVKGICFGRFARCESKEGPNVEDVIKAFSRKLEQSNACPILKNLPFGHWGKSTPIPMGVNAEIKESKLTTLESPIA